MLNVKTVQFSTIQFSVSTDSTPKHFSFKQFSLTFKNSGISNYSV